MEIETECILGSLENVKIVQEIPQDAKEILHEFRDVFPEHLPKELPPTRSVDHKIELKPGILPARLTYRMSTMELKVLREQLDDLLQSGYI